MLDIRISARRSATCISVRQPSEEPFGIWTNQLPIFPGGGDRPRWRKDGKEIFYVTADGQLMAAEVIARNGTLEVGKVEKLFDAIVTGRSYGSYTYDVSADGETFLVVDDGIGATRPLPLTLFQNWTTSLRK